MQNFEYHQDIIIFISWVGNHFMIAAWNTHTHLPFLLIHIVRPFFPNGFEHQIALQMENEYRKQHAKSSKSQKIHTPSQS